MSQYTCPCCGYKTLKAEPPGSFNICPICFWEDDNFQYHHPDVAVGANSVYLREAQSNFKTFGACDKVSIDAVRSPNENDIRDPNWEPLDS
jgi:hypothetical protein